MLSLLCAGSPNILLSLTLWKPRPLRLLESLTMKQSLWAYHFTITDRSVVSLSSTTSFQVLHPLLFPCFNPLLPGFCRAHTVDYHPPSGETTKIQDHLHSFVPLFSPTCGSNFPILFNLIPPSRSSRQLFTTTSDHSQFKTMIFFLRSLTPSHSLLLPNSQLPLL